ncbi:MAG: cryptochrome/photolyase family protein [Alphaproteobacteria bacterium]|nr:MAG: cryptochrome/photolyase family protein [Alphaproteobacteria bacterium]
MHCVTYLYDKPCWCCPTPQENHKQKLAFLWSAQAAYINELEQFNFQVRYQPLESSLKEKCWTDELIKNLKEKKVTEVFYFEPAEWHIKNTLKKTLKSENVKTSCLADPKFICNEKDFKSWAQNQKSLLMENFYRKIRESNNILMDDSNPVGGKWNHDHDNRKPLPRNYKVAPHLRFQPSEKTKEVIEFVDKNFPDHIGNTTEFSWGVTRAQAHAHLKAFIKDHLSCFGNYQDAMSAKDPVIHHSLISQYINIGLLNPLEVCHEAEKAYKKGAVPLNSTEGFIRQILGWREYMRGVYWLKMPEYDQSNFFNHKRKLPSFYWTADTDLNCLKSSIQNTIDHAYAHHIQRLMITANFATLAGLDPAEVNEWYYVVYIDAFEWVQLPNTHGMGLFADGGVLSTKPYVSSGAYINRMSDYCANCKYDVKKRTGKDACPFNFLYWHFMDKNQSKLKKNPRMRLAYMGLGKIKSEMNAINEQADQFFKSDLFKK